MGGRAMRAPTGGTNQVKACQRKKDEEFLQLCILFLSVGVVSFDAALSQAHPGFFLVSSLLLPKTDLARQVVHFLHDGQGD